MRAYFRLILLAIFVLAAASAASAQTTPTFGHVDNREAPQACSYLSGWAFGPTATTQPIDLYVFKNGPAPSDPEATQKPAGTFVTWGQTYWNRPDIQAIYGGGVEGYYGFDMPTPTTLMTDTENEVYVYAVDSSTNEEVRLGGSPFKFTCPKPTPISGHIENQFGFPLPSDGWFGTSVTLFRIDNSGRRDRFSYTTCPEDGCADNNGDFQFYGGHNGERLTESDYETWVVANGHVIDRQTFHYDPLYGAYVIHKLAIEKLHLEWMYAPYSFVSGAPMTPQFSLCNFNLQSSVVAAKVMLSGPGLKKDWNERQHNFVLENIPPQGECTERGLDVPVNALRPDGQWYNNFIEFTNSADEDDVYTQGWASSLKGVMDPPDDFVRNNLAAAKKKFPIPWEALGVKK